MGKISVKKMRYMLEEAKRPLRMQFKSNTCTGEEKGRRVRNSLTWQCRSKKIWPSLWGVLKLKSPIREDPHFLGIFLP